MENPFFNTGNVVGIAAPGVPGIFDPASPGPIGGTTPDVGAFTTLSATKSVWLAATELTLASDIVTVTQSLHTIDTEADAATDNLATINGGASGQLLAIRASHTDRTVVVKDGTGNILAGGDDISLDDTSKYLLFVYDGALSKWVVIGGGGLAAIAAESILANATGSSAIPSAIAVGQERLVGRITGGHIDDLSPTEVRTLLGLVASAAASDFLVGEAATGNWVKKTLAETLAILMPSPGTIGATTPPVVYDTKRVVTHSATEAVLAADMYGADHLVIGAYTDTLPAAVIGMHARFMATTAAVFSLDSNAADQFRLGGSLLTAGYKISSDGALGAECEVVCRAANIWEVINTNCVFIDGGA